LQYVLMKLISAGLQLLITLLYQVEFAYNLKRLTLPKRISSIGLEGFSVIKQ
jgi:hypothetical protein